jgi:hypothetical protein
MQTGIRLPSPATSKEAQVALRALSGLPKRKTSRTIFVKADGEAKGLSVTVPKEAFERFLEILGQMANGNAVTQRPAGSAASRGLHGTGAGTLVARQGTSVDLFVFRGSAMAWPKVMSRASMFVYEQPHRCIRRR